MNPKLGNAVNFIVTHILPPIYILIFVLLLYFSLVRILLWAIFTPLIDANVHRVLSLLALPNAQVDLGSLTEGARRFVTIFSTLLLLATNKFFRHARFWLACIPLAATLTISGVSQFWSIAPVYTISRFLYLLAAGLGGFLIGFELKKTKIVWLLEIFAVLMVLGNFIMVLKYPSFAIMRGDGLEGAWRGLFSWKSYAGEVMTFSAIMFLFRLANFKKERWWIRIYSLVFYLLAIFSLYKSQSATEVISLVVVHIVFVLAILYLQWGHRLQPIHWWIFAATGIVALLLAWFGRDIWIGVIGRSSSFTGRIPLWNALMPFIRERLYFGYGFGEAFWKAGGYALLIEKAAGWPAPYAHNGYIETLLGVGVVGFIFFMTFLIQIAFLSIKYFVREHSLPALIFFALLVEIIVANIADNQLGSHDAFALLLLITAFAILLRDRLEQNQNAISALPGT
jgi:O-antigen ligase